MSVAIKIRRGATLDLPLEFFADLDETTPLDLTGSTMSVIESTFPSVTPALSVTDEVAGTARLQMDATDTADLVVNRTYKLVLKQVQPGGAIVKHGPLVFLASDE